jgi:CheY-like chemotaxis protein
MDVQMPEMDGMKATTIIRDKEKLSGVHPGCDRFDCACDEGKSREMFGCAYGRVFD